MNKDTNYLNDKINANTYVINAGDTPSIQDHIVNRPAPKIIGRLFLDIDTGILYRDTGKYWKKLQLRPQGPPGLSYITGIGAPTCDIGQIGDIYIDISTGQLYLKLDSCSMPNCTWIEYPNNPVYEPVTPAYYQTVRYDQSQFIPYCPSAFYKMWYDFDSAGGIAMATSSDGISWAFNSNMTGLISTARHSRVLFSRDGFGTCTPYRIWYWNSTTPYIIDAEPQMIRTAVSVDGITWTNDTRITQDPTAPLLPLVTASITYNGSYGPADILYFPENSPTLDKTNPFNNRYVMYYDVTNGAIEEIALAVSADGNFWARIGNQPVLPRGSSGQWDQNYACEGAVVLRLAPNNFKMWYSGGITHSYEGIGCASSTDGINWTKFSGNPVFSISQGVPWRTARTYNPWALYDSKKFSCHGDLTCFKLWLTGGNVVDHPDIGYATMQGCFWLPLI
ncbi:hypothetical protein ACN077_08635 [Clostridium chromiireducens]|uniref:hypothetical protein n=1 Tax=Clostridium chromiireducens TaxID=225345 RepID=UPI003AF6F056